MTLLLTRKDIDAILVRRRAALFDDLIAQIESGYREIASGQAQQHNRIYLRPTDDALRRPKGLFSMSALLPGARRMGTRLLALGGPGPGNGGDGVLILFDHETQKCLAIINDQGPVHNHRSGAPSGLATRLLARKDARGLGVIGSSGMALGGLALVSHVRPGIETIKVFSPAPANRERFAKEMTAVLGKKVTPVATPEEAAEGMDIIVTATDADRPVVPDSAIDPGTHINLMARNEIEMRTFARSTLVMGSVDAHRALDPPWLDPLPEEWTRTDIADVITGKAPGRTSPDEITVFSGGSPVSMWDVAAASAFYEAGRALGLGREISLDE